MNMLETPIHFTTAFATLKMAHRTLQHLLPVLKPFPQDTQPSETTMLLPKNSRAIEEKAQP